MLSEKCVRAVFGGGLGCLEEMSALSVRAPGLQAAAVLETRSIRVRGVTTLESVRRNLFGCNDREENRRFLEKELARQLELDSQRWGFDFAKERPLPGSQFAWQLVPASTVPAALRRSPITTPKPNASPQETKVANPSIKKQKNLEEFMKPRKRLANSGKKSPSHKHECGHGAHIRPPKVARLVQTRLKRPS